MSSRLAALAQVTDDALPGLPDRLDSVIGELATLSTSIERVEVALPEALLEPRWRALLAALRAAGVTVAPLRLEPAAAAGYLAGARTRSFAPTGDGSLVLYRPYGPLMAAEELAGALAARDGAEDILLIGANRVLSDALVRAGLPRPAAPGRVPASMASLRLVVELIFQPADPALLYKLLCLDPGPVPRSIGRRLMRVLSRHPGRGNEAWRDAIDEGVAAADEERRERLRERLVGLLQPVVDRDQPVPVEEVLARTRLLATWARGVAERLPSVAGVVMASELFIRVLRQLPAPTIIASSCGDCSTRPMTWPASRPRPRPAWRQSTAPGRCSVPSRSSFGGASRGTLRAASACRGSPRPNARRCANAGCSRQTRRSRRGPRRIAGDDRSSKPARRSC